MLMDSTGGSSSVPGESGSLLTPPETMPSGEVMDFDDFANGERAQEAETSPLNPEENVAVPEMASETQSSTMPVMAPPVEESEETAVTPEVENLQKIDIPRDAEELPKEYVAAVSKVIESDKKDPYQLVSDLDKARWDLLKKAYGRKIGDGLNGGA